MNISRISRRIVVAIFVVFVLCLTCLNIMLVLKDTSNSSMSLKLAKYAFPFILILLSVGYAFIKEKMYKLKMNRKISLLYRYVYLVIIFIAICIYNLYEAKLDISSLSSISFVAISCLIAIVIKKIIFNVSKSDILSVIAALTYVLLPDLIVVKSEYFVSMLMTLFFVLAIFFIQKLIDELKQQGIKTKKYILFTVLSSIFSGLTLVLGLEVFVYIPLIILFLFITYNLDITHVNFSSKIFDNLSFEKKELLYKIERININKLIVSIAIIVVVTGVILTIFNFAFIFSNTNNEYLNEVKGFQNYSDRFTLEGYDFSINSIKQNTQNLLNQSNMFYMIAFIYILFIEVLTVTLRRKYDTKSTVLKILFMSILGLYALSSSNVLFYHNICMVVVILIAIVNTSNIYLNRDERIKLLKA